MNAFYALPLKTQALLYVGGIIVGTLILLFLILLYAVKAERKERVSREKNITIRITITNENDPSD